MLADFNTARDKTLLKRGLCIQMGSIGAGPEGAPASPLSTVVESVGHPHPLATSGCAESAWDCRRGNLPAQILGSCAIRKGLSVASLS